MGRGERGNKCAYRHEKEAAEDRATPSQDAVLAEIRKVPAWDFDAPSKKTDTAKANPEPKA